MMCARWAAAAGLAFVIGAGACAGGASESGAGVEVRGSALNSSVVVTVVDTDGVPQVGVGIEAYKTNGTPVGWEGTDTQGKATFSLPAASYVFQTEDYNYDFSSPTCTTPGCTGVTITVPHPVTVTVVDTNGAPKPNVGITAADPDGNTVNYVTTDDSGQAVIYVPAGTYQFMDLDESGGEFDSATCVVPGCTTATITVSVPVVVTVRDTAGNPIADQPVWGETPDGNVNGWEVTDAAGQVSDVMEPGDWRFVTTFNGTDYASGAPGSCSVPGCTAATISIPPAVVLTVVDGSGNPVAGQDIFAEEQTSGNGFWSTTGSDGTVALQLQSGAWQMAASCGCQVFYSGAAGSCAVPGCTTAQITMHCGGICDCQPDGTACDDGNACTQTDTCQNSLCVGTNPVTCSAQDQCHTGTCDPSTGTCSNQAKADGTACDDGNACTQTDTCQSGTCTGANPVSCVAQDQCHAAGTCDPASGACTNPLAANGTACTDGNQCVIGKTCQVGFCTGGQSTPCSGSGSNTSMSIAASGGSVSLETATVTFAAGAFTDATGVTVTSTTAAAPTGVSAYSPRYKFTPDGAQFPQPVTATFVVGVGLTRPTVMWSRPDGGWDDLGGTYAGGMISATVAHFSEGFVAESQCAGQPDGTACTDGDACTTETCQGGLCTHLSNVTCSAPDQCHTSVCDPAVGCTSPPAANGTLCDDGNPATQGDVCETGVCAPAIQNLSIDDLGTLGGTSSSAQAVNATGQVIGTSTTSDGVNHAFLWTPPGPIADLGLASGTTASALSDSGFIAGTVKVGQSSHVFSFSPDQQFADLGPLGDDQPMVDPYSGWTYQGAVGAAVNDSGQIAGSVATGGQFRGFLYTPGQGWIDIGDLGQRSTWASGIASDGTVVGASQLPDTPATTYAHFGHAVMYRDGMLIDLNNYLDPTSGFTLVYADAINDKYIVGTAQGGGAQVPFRFNRTTEAVEILPTAWAGETFTFGVDSVGEVIGIGYVDAAQTQQASFIYSDQLGFRNLNDLIPTNSGWNLAGAAGINDSGDIVGWGWYNGTVRAFRLRVSPETIACDGQATNPGSVCLWVDGVVDRGAGQYMAVFGYQNAGTDTIKPTANQELINGQPVANPQPSPPEQLPPGTHPGVFLPIFSAGETVSWTVDGQTVTTSASTARELTATQLGSTGTGVEVEDSLVTVTPDTGQYGIPPQKPPIGRIPNLGDQYFGSLKGSLTVSPGGAAIYTIPITIPPGTAGMAPSLTLTYNSQGPDGIAGQGWSLTGLSMIHRCPKNRIDDGYTQPIKMGTFFGDDRDDGICMDGQRLFRQSDGSYVVASGEFSTIIPVISQADSSSFDGFKVRTKSGQWRYYGLRAESRVTFPSSEGDVAGRVAAWALDRVEDIWGNYYDVHYNDGLQDFSTRGLIATSITYTGHHDSSSADCGNTGTNICPPNVITLTYEKRPDQHSSRFHNSVLPMNQRLSTITTPLGTYSVNYYQVGDTPDEALLPSRPKSVSYCAGPLGSSNRVCLESLSFTWDQGGYNWDEVQPATVVGQENSYALPVSLAIHSNPTDGAARPNGVQFVDLDGDGRVDLIESRDQQYTTGQSVDYQLYDTQNHVWRNAGSGWQARDDWALPTTLFDGNGKPKAVLADVDGDGMVDLVAKGSDGRPVVYYNRIRLNQGWVAEGGASAATFPSSWGALHLDRQSDGTLDTVVDVDGDGVADIVRLAPPFVISVLSWTYSGWVPSSINYSVGDPTYGYSLGSMTFQDVNRDGLPDLVGDGTSTWAGLVLLNMGKTFQQSVQWTPGPRPSDLPTYLSFDQHMADIDGDGFDDVIEHYRDTTGTYAAIQVGTGSGYAAPLDTTYTDDLTAHQQSSLMTLLSQVMDVNGDGLVDVLELPSNCSLPCGFGQLLVNTGYGLSDPTGLSGSISVPNDYSTPFLPDPNYKLNGNAVVDLDGDGLSDFVLTKESSFPQAGTFTTTAWINKFHRPVITGFPNGLASPSQVTYTVITKAEAQGTTSVYDDTVPLAPNTRYTAAPLRVVSKVDVDSGLGSGVPRATTTYHYSSLRASATGHGPQGFASVSSTDPSGTVTITDYSQSYPFTGLAASVTKLYNVGDGGTPYRFSQTSTTYCAYQVGSATPPGTWPSCFDQFQEGPEKSYFVYPVQVNDTNWLLTGTSADRAATNPYSSTVTSYTYDDRGSPTLTQIVTKLVTQPGNSATDEEYWKTVQVDYGGEGSDTQLMGKSIASTTKTWKQKPDVEGAKTHVTTFGYAATAVSVDEVSDIPVYTIALNYTDNEQGSGYPLELATAYAYDVFGNVVTTTECDNAVSADHCTPGAPGPGAQPYRTTTVSYDPADFVAPPGSGLRSSVPYEAGRFPVRRTNAMGHTDYLVYDPNLGAPVQTTDPNQVTTCLFYDPLGTKTSEISRCGTASATTTTTVQYLAADAAAPATAAAVTVTSPPDGRTSWVYTDVLGREVATFSRNFSGGLTETLTNYTALGQVHAKSQPFDDGDAVYWTTSQYDGLNRVTQTTQDLGVINDGQPATSQKTVTYLGNSVTTTEVVRGENQQRAETKNALGKVAAVTDAASGTLMFSYDPDGNLVGVAQNGLDPSQTATYGYDNRGRKTSSSDPDMGQWQYTYDGFGDLLTQTDALGQTTTMTYDALGRMLTRTDAAGTTEWIYDQSVSGPAVGKLGAMIGPPSTELNSGCSIPLVHFTDGNRPGKWFAYDSFQQMTDAYECVDGVTYRTTYDHDAIGRTKKISYPAIGADQLTVGYNYTDSGFLQYVSDASDGSSLWVATARNARGQVTSEYTRNGVSTVNGRSLSTGWLLSSVSTAQADSDHQIQNWAYQYDEAGDLLNRHRLDQIGTAESDETFGYDSLNRLTSARVTIPSRSYDQKEDYGYDGLGNLTVVSRLMWKLVTAPLPDAWLGLCSTTRYAAASSSRETTSTSFS